MTVRVIKVLYVEVEEDDILFMKRALAGCCRAVDLEVARDGDEAICVLSDGHYRPDWVVLDLKMPRRTGIEVLQWIRSHPTLNDMPVSVLSSSAEQSDLARVQELGIIEYIVKPVNYEGLIQVVRSLCARWGVVLPLENEPPRSEV
jgi:CheY-like chemotaxis protein